MQSAQVVGALDSYAADLKTLKIIAADNDYIEKETGQIKKRFSAIFQ